MEPSPAVRYGENSEHGGGGGGGGKVNPTRTTSPSSPSARQPTLSPRMMMSPELTFIDLTHTLDATTPVYPGDPPFHAHPHRDPTTGFSIHALSLSSHAGTHIDAPSHLFPAAPTISALPLSTFLRPALVLDLSHTRARAPIAWADIRPHAARIVPGAAVLLCTGWSRFWGTDRYFDHPYLEPEAAEELAKRGVAIVGVDTMSPDPSPRVGEPAEPDAPERLPSASESASEAGFGAHHALLGAGCVIAENLANLEALMEVQEGLDAGKGERLMVSLVPLKIAGCDGSPVRAFAWKA